MSEEDGLKPGLCQGVPESQSERRERREPRKGSLLSNYLEDTAGNSDSAYVTGRLNDGSFEYTAVSDIGSRSKQEDSIMIEDCDKLLRELRPDFSETTYHDKVFLAVVDGHGGRFVPLWLRKNLVRLIVKTQQYKDGNYAQAIAEGIRKAEKNLSEDDRARRSGAGVCAAIVETIAMKMHIATVGDCRAVLFDKSGGIEFVTLDHSPHNEAEQKRIEDLGGDIDFKMKRVGSCFAPREEVDRDAEARIFPGDINFTRSLGVYKYKLLHNPPLVIPEAETHTIDIKDTKLILLASDGLFGYGGGFLSNDEVKKICFDEKLERDTKIAEQITRSLVSNAKKKARERSIAIDNISVIVLNRLEKK